MRKFIKNKAHPSLALIDRTMTKAQFKEIWGEWRGSERIKFIGTDAWHICGFIEKDRNKLDPLLIKSLSLAVNIEYSQMLEAA